jgi:hypothetical protein
MSTDAVTPLRQRMIEDMNARKLCAGTQRGPRLQTVRCVSQALSRNGYLRTSAGSSCLWPKPA